MGKPKIYIASPYTKGDVAVNVKAQIDAFAELMDKGFAPFAPLYSHFQHMAHPRSYEKWLEQDFEWIPSCDCLLRLPGESSGADKEVELAKSLGKPVFYSIDELTAHYSRISKMKVFVICSVRGMDEGYRKKLEDYVTDLEQNHGVEVHLPHRDTNQNNSGLEICQENMSAIKEADAVHIFYSSKSQGTHFDMGVAFALGKPIKVVESEEIPEGKNFQRMLKEWESR